MSEIIRSFYDWWNGPREMSIYSFERSEKPTRVCLAVQDFSVPADYLSTDLEGGYRVFYPALEYKRDTKTRVMGKPFFGKVYLVKIDPQYGYCDFEYTQ